MCTVVGYVGNKDCRAFVMEGLLRLEYRGYDSSGFACLQKQTQRVACVKSQGGIDQLAKKIALNPVDGFLGVGHTRWATHGTASDTNAHPHFDCYQEIALVHNGIIENFRELKQELEIAEHRFISQTDSEVIAHLLEEALLTRSLEDAAHFVVDKLQGAYAFVAIMQKHPEVILAVRKRSPLCLGIGKDEVYIASDVLAFAGNTDQVVFMPDESFAIIRKDRFDIFDFIGKRIEPVIQKVSCAWIAGGKNGYEHFMLKEIYEQSRVIADTVTFLRSITGEILDHLGVKQDFLIALQRVQFIGCGSSWHTGRIAKFFFEEIALLPAEAAVASEFRFNHLFLDKKTWYIAISQSGETADTLEALRMVNETSMPTLAIANVISSTIVRESTGFLLTQAGQEIAVASTKALTAQIAALFWLAHYVAFSRGVLSRYDMNRAEEDLLVAGKVLENAIEQYKLDIIIDLAPRYAMYKTFIFIGRHISFPFALEAALKLKEISYVFVDCYAAGELKHGALALIDAQVPVFVFSSLDELVYKKLIGNAQEVKARDGHLVVFAFEGQSELIALADYAFIFPKVHRLLAPLAMIGLMQFFAYHIAKTLGRPIDKPRNLAKSVTVE